MNDELVHLILLRSDAATVARAAGVNRTWNRIASYSLAHRFDVGDSVASALPEVLLELVERKVEQARLASGRALNWTEGGEKRQQLRAIFLKAAKCGRDDVIETLLTTAPLELDATDFENGHTALHVLAKYGCVRSMRTLLDLGALVDVRKRPPSGVDVKKYNSSTPLHVACRRGHAGCVQLLLSRGADVRRPGEFGKTAVDFALGLGRAEVLRVLLRFDATLLARCLEHCVRSRATVRNGHNGIILALLEAEAREAHRALLKDDAAVDGAGRDAQRREQWSCIRRDALELRKTAIFDLISARTATNVHRLTLQTPLPHAALC